MPILVTETVDDGAYIDQSVPVAGVPSGVSGFEMCLIGPGARTKGVSETIVRGGVTDETLTVAATSPHVATIAPSTAVRATRNSRHTVVYRNGRVLPLNAWSWVTPSVSGSVAFAPTADLSTAGTYPSFGISVDSLPAVTISLQTGGTAGAIVVNGTRERQIFVSVADAFGVVTGTNLVAAINGALNGTLAQALGYDASHAYASLNASNQITITGKSGVSSTLANVRLIASVTDSALTLIFGAAAADEANRTALSRIQIADEIYDLGSATYTIDYARVATDSEEATHRDAPALASVVSISGVGSRQNASDYILSTDWQNTSGTIDWTPDVSAEVEGVTPSGATFDLTTLKRIKLGFDGFDPEEMQLDGLTGEGDITTPTGVLGYVEPADPSVAPLAQIVNNINAMSAYFFGPDYRAVASGTTEVTVSSLVQGIGGSVVFEAPASADATSLIFGGDPVETGMQDVTQGVGRRPSPGTAYYINYTAARPAAEYNRRRLFRDPDLARRELGGAASDNILGTCVELAFLIGVSSLSVIQVNDAAIPGTMTRAELRTGLLVTKKSPAVTELVPLAVGTEVILDLNEQLSVRNAGSNGQYCRGWIGAASNTEVGDPDTAGSYSYIGRRTAQVSAENPARGRLIGIAPPTQRALTYTTPDGEILSMEGYHLATVAAARRMTFSSPKLSLAKTTCNVFDTDIDDDELWSSEERLELINSGWLVMRFNGGVFEFGKPVTFEFGRQTRVDEYAYESTSPQKDNVYRIIIAALEENLVGVVPSTPVEFALNVRSIIARAISSQIPGALGQYEDVSGNARTISLQRDISVRRATAEGGSRVRWLFGYSAFLAYPALEFTGTAFWDRALPGFGSITASDLS